MVEITNLGQFPADIDRIAKAIDQQPGVVRRRIAADIFERVQRRTPVDTGRARAGWELFDGFNASEVINRVPYIVVLEFGGSPRQAPQGMVRITLAEIEAELESRFVF